MAVAAEVAVEVAVEVLVLRLTGAGCLAYRVLRRALTSRTPDDVALEAAGVTTAASPGTVSHSTSWRRTDGGRIVLTYAVLPDPEPGLPAHPLAAVGVVCSPDPLRPGPDLLHDHHVAAHAVRHLAHLVESDPTVAAAAGHHPDLWREVARFSQAVRVGTHDHAHRADSGPASTG